LKLYRHRNVLALLQVLKEKRALRELRPGSGIKVRSELVERLLDRGVLHDETRAITRNRQPGRCCDTGCTTPGQAVMVPLPNRMAGKLGAD
jgi:hypothetical protein